MVFIAGWIMQVVIIFGYPYTPDYYRDVVVGTVLFTLLPWYISLPLDHGCPFAFLRHLDVFRVVPAPILCLASLPFASHLVPFTLTSFALCLLPLQCTLPFALLPFCHLFCERPCILPGLCCALLQDLYQLSPSPQARCSFQLPLPCSVRSTRLCCLCPLSSPTIAPFPALSSVLPIWVSRLSYQRYYSKVVGRA